MVSSLRYTTHKNFGNIDYLHYFRRMIRDYESRKLSNKDSHIYRLTRMAEILYGNLNQVHWADLVEN